MTTSKKEKDIQRGWRIGVLLGTFYIVVILFSFLYQFLIGFAEKNLLNLVIIIPINSNALTSFFEGLLTFCSILFGFYSVVLIEAISL